MKRVKGHVVIFLDNTTSHPSISLSFLHILPRIVKLLTRALFKALKSSIEIGWLKELWH